MSKRMFTLEQQKELLGNENVVRCSEGSITYSPAFKKRAVEQYKQGMTSREIFEEAGFDLILIGREQPKRCLRRWRKKYKRQGSTDFSDERGTKSTGRKPVPQDRTPEEKIKRLEAEIVYLKAENAFLAKLRARRAE